VVRADGESFDREISWRECGSEYFRRSSQSPTQSAQLPTGPSCARTRTPRVKKWDRVQYFGSLSRRRFHKDPRTRCCTWTSAPHHAHEKGQRHEMIAAPELLDHACGKAFIGDTGYDSDEFRTAIRKRKRLPVIHAKPERSLAFAGSCRQSDIWSNASFTI
jgi:hypothetical protein